MKISEKTWGLVESQLQSDCCLREQDAASRRGADGRTAGAARRSGRETVRIARTPRLPGQAYMTDEAYAFLVRERLEKETGRQPRIYEGMDPFFRAVFFRGRAWMTADERIYDWCVREYKQGKGRPEWFGQFPDLRRLDDMLRRYGRQIRDCRIQFLPAEERAEAPGGLASGGEPGGAREDAKEPTGMQNGKAGGQEEASAKGVRICWYEEGELAQIRDRGAFRHALCVSGLTPGMLAAAAVVGTETVGMAGATEDSPLLWQIGVDVKAGWEGRGIASMLVRLLKEEILRRGKIPFYGTSQSHIVSMDTAIEAGFLPAWTEVYVCRRE